MGAFSRKQLKDAVPAELSLIRDCKSYTMFQRGPYWYVNFRRDGKQYRISLGLADYQQAVVVVETFRANTMRAPQLYRDEHLYRMIERARYRNRHKGIPFALSIDLLREVVARADGCCEVTGHRLEDAGPFRPSLDRIDPRLGYVPGNVRIVCLITNTAMLHYGEAAFGELAIAYCRRIGVLPQPV